MVSNLQNGELGKYRAIKPVNEASFRSACNDVFMLTNKEARYVRCTCCQQIMYLRDYSDAECISFLDFKLKCAESHKNQFTPRDVFDKSGLGYTEPKEICPCQKVFERQQQIRKHILMKESMTLGEWLGRCKASVRIHYGQEQLERYEKNIKMLSHHTEYLLWLVDQKL